MKMSKVVQFSRDEILGGAILTTVLYDNGRLFVGLMESKVKICEETGSICSDGEKMCWEEVNLPLKGR